jgi:hypothetical protein
MRVAAQGIEQWSSYLLPPLILFLASALFLLIVLVDQREC